MGQVISTAKRKQRQEIELRRVPTLFNKVFRDVCRNSIAPHLTADDIEAVLKTSASMRDLFQGSRIFGLMKNANLVLQEVMAADPVKVDARLHELKKIYGEDFWQLLVTRTRGTEARGQQWQAISAIEFCVYAGDFSDDPGHGYLLNRLLDYIPLQHRHIAVAQITAMNEPGTVQYGEKRGLLSAIHKLDMSYDTFIDYAMRLSPRKSDSYWRKHVVAAQKNLPESSLREFCRPIAWTAFPPDFRHLAAPPPAQMPNGKPVFSAPFYCRGWGIYHADNAFVRIAISERNTGISWRLAARDRDVFRMYSKIKKEQLDALIGEQMWLISEYVSGKAAATVALKP